MKIKFIEDTQKFKKGEIAESSKKSAESYIKNGYAVEYVEEPKKKKIVKKKIKKREKPTEKEEQTKKRKTWQSQFDNLCEKNGIEVDAKGFEKLKALGVDEYFKILILQVQEFLKTNEEDVTLKVGPVKIYARKKEKIEEKKSEEERELEILRESCIKFEYTKEGEIKKVKVLIPIVVGYLLNKHNFKTIFGSKFEEIFTYHEGIYAKNGREIIQTQTEKILGEHCSNHYIKEIVEKVKRLSAVSKEKFDNLPEELICLENGILNLKTSDLIEYNPRYYFKTKIPIKYNKEAKCPEIKKFFEEVLYLEDIDVMQEWFGFCLYRRYFIKKAMILFGGTDTGKTVFLNLLMKFLGKKNTTGISLQRISSGDKFALVFLKDKYANIHDDLSSRDLIAGGFKEATGGGYLSAEYKFGDGFQFLSFAKHIFATNQIPSLKEIDLNDEAYYNRWMPIPFDNKIEEKKQDKFFINKITTEEELSGLLNYALDGLKRLLKNGRFSFKKKWTEIKEIMERYGDPLAAFCQDILVKEEGNKITKSAMFEIYSLYVNDKNVARLSKEQLGRRLEKYVSYVLAKHGSKERWWENVGINPNLTKNSFNKEDTIDSLKISTSGFQKR